jgi:hypothetical protein
MILDRTGGAVFPGFAHLAGGGQFGRAIAVHRETLARHITLALFMTALFLAFNGSFVHLWVGEGLYAGTKITFLIGVAGLPIATAGVSALLYYRWTLTALSTTKRGFGVRLSREGLLYMVFLAGGLVAAFHLHLARWTGSTLCLSATTLACATLSVLIDPMLAGMRVSISRKPDLIHPGRLCKRSHE